MTTNLWGERWAKLCQNSMGNPVAAASGMGIADLNKHARGRELQIRLAQECAEVGLALGHKVENFGGRPADVWAAASKGDVFEVLDAALAENISGANWRPSMAQETPVKAAITDVIRAIDAREVEAEYENVERVLTAAGY